MEQNPVNPANIQNTVSQTVNQVNQAVAQPVQQAQKSFKKKPFLIVGILLVILIVVIAFVRTNMSKPQLPASSAQDLVLATVAGEKIYKSDVEEEALIQYEKSAINDEVIQTYLNSIIEQKILSYGASQAGIKVEATESAARAKQMIGSGSAEISPAILTAARYDLLKEKIMSQFVSSRTISMVGFWTPSDEYIRSEGLTQNEADLAKKQQTQGKTALLQIAVLVRRGIEPLDATRAVMADSAFSDLSKIIAVNGYVLDKSNDDTILKTPRVYTSSEQNSVEKYFYDAIFSMKKGDIRSVLNPNESSGYVIKILDAKEGQYKSYKDWFNDKFRDLVVLYNYKK